MVVGIDGSEPSKALIDASERAQLLVLGSRGYGGYREVVLGSVSQQCAHHAACRATVTHGERRRRGPGAAHLAPAALTVRLY